MAFSGGMDSVVLLHSLHRLAKQQQLPAALAALHINHQINPQAMPWQRFCAEFCEQRQIPFDVMTIKVDGCEASGLEERAREARYAAFEQWLEDDDLLLMAHHLDDQLENLLLRLSRGAGPGGLAGMPAFRRLGRGALVRPLLNWSRPQLLSFAQAEGLSWVDDDSNADVRFDRNFLRHWVMPVIAQRWPDYRESWQKSRQLCQEADQLLTVLARQDLDLLVTDNPAVISLSPMQHWDAPRQRNLLRYWLGSLGAPEPGWHLLRRLTDEVITARKDAAGVLSWQGLRVQRYRQQLHALRETGLPLVSAIAWDPQLQSDLEWPGNGSLRCLATGERLSLVPGDTLTVAYRQGGERCRLRGRPEKSVKRLLQEAGVAPWLRDRYPLLYLGDELVCLPGIGVAAARGTQDAAGIAVQWTAPVLHYGGESEDQTG